MSAETTATPFEYHEGPPVATPDELGAGWPYDKSGLEERPGDRRAGEETDEAQTA